MQNMSWDTACRGIYWYYESIKKAAVRHTPTLDLKSFNKLSCMWYHSIFHCCHDFLSTSLDHLANQDNHCFMSLYYTE